MTNEQKRDLMLKGRTVLTAILDAVKLVHELDELMVQRAAGGLLTDAATMIGNEIKTRCQP